MADWWDTTDFSLGDIGSDYTLDPSLFDLGGLGGGTGIDPSQFNLGGDQWVFDTQTGQVISVADAQRIDPSFTPPANGFSLTGQPQPGGGGGLDPTQYRLPPASDPWWGSLDAKTVIGALTAAGGLGALGLGIGSLFGGNDPKNQTTTQTSTGGRAAMTPEMQSLLGSGGGVGGQGGTGVSGGVGGGGTGLLGLSNMMIQNLMGPGQGGAPGGAPSPWQAAPGQGVPPIDPSNSNFGWQNNGASGLGQPAPGAQIGQISEMPGGLQTRVPGSIGYAGGTPNFNEQTGQYAPGTGPLWAQTGATGQNAAPQQGRPDLNPPFAPAVRQWNEATGQYGYNPGYGPSPGGGAMALPQGQPQNWPAVPGSGGGYLSAPSGGGQPQQGGGQGLIGQQSNVLGGLQSQIPQLNPAIMQALGMQAQGMAQGYLPSLSDPQAQSRIQSIYQPGFDALNYNSGLALSNAREQLQQRGFQAPDIREGPTQALTAPILAAQQLGRSQLYGQMAGAQLDLASRLPMLASQLNAQNYSTQAQPFNLGTQLAGAYNQPIQTQGQFPLSLLDILQRGQGTTQTVNTVGPQPSLTQQLGQVAPLVGAAGSMFGSAGNMLWPQQQQQVGLSGIMPQYYSGG